MQKQAPTLGRLLVMVAFALSCFGLLLFLWLAFGGPIPLKPKGYRMQASFNEATQLAVEADVRISGVSVGRVKDVRTQRDGRSLATIELEQRYAPIPRDTRSILRQKTLLGETYVELSPGNRGGGMLPEGGRLPVGAVSPTVELDEILRAFDPRTRRAFMVWMESQAQAVNGRGADLNEALGQLGPFTEETTQLLEILNSQRGAVRALVANTGTVFAALSERRGQLRDLITNSERVFATTGARDRELADTFRVLPTFETEATRTVRRLETFARDTDPLIGQLRPAARELSPTLQQLTALAPDLEGLFGDLGPLIDASARGLPATTRFLDDLRPFLGEFDPILRQLNPILDYLGDYREELVAFFANSAAATNAFTTLNGRPVRYLRTANPLNPENLAIYPRRIGSNRTSAYRPAGAFGALSTGLRTSETRQCGRRSPTISATGNESLAAITENVSLLLARIQQFGFAGAPAGAVPAPPCRKQPKFSTSGELTDFPHVRAAPSSTARPSRTAAPSSAARP